ECDVAASLTASPQAQHPAGNIQLYCRETRCGAKMQVSEIPHTRSSSDEFPFCQLLGRMFFFWPREH
ncbi:unnamed protein product, partial [Nesidiocoris tenuis]